MSALQIDGLHPNAETAVLIEVYDYADYEGQVTKYASLPKHIHIKPTAMQGLSFDWCEKCGYDHVPGRTYNHVPQAQTMVREVQPTEVVDIMNKLEERIDNAGILRPLVDFFMEAKHELNALIADRERKAAVEALKQVIAYVGPYNTPQSNAYDLIAQYERGE